MKESKRIQKLKEKKVNHKLGIIVPYRDREQQLKRFLSHMKDYIKDIDYEIFIIEQADDKPFNRGKLLNAGYKYALDKGCDYFVFHDVDMLPEDVDYSYSDKPLHLATHLQEHDYETTFFDYFGGVTMFTKEDFKTINGFSNEYWGWGFEDDDLLIRCLDSNLQLDMDSNGSDNIQEIESFKFDGNDSFIKLSTDKKLHLLEDEFTISVMVKPENIKLSVNKDYDEFPILSIPGYNIGYADKNDTIFYISNGIIPKRNNAYNWTSIIPGNTKKTLWNEYYKTEELPQVISPKSGYVYNANHSPFKSTSLDENPNPKDYAKNMNFEQYDNNRSTRIFELINSYESIDYNAFKEIKYDHTFPTPFTYSFMSVNNLFEMKPDDYPEIKELLIEIQNWDRKTNVESVGAGTYAMFYYNLDKYYRKGYINRNFGKDIIAQSLREVKEKMLKNFKTTKVKLGDYQKLVRGDKEIPIWGMQDVITAMNASNYKDGKIRVTHGESYIQFAKFTENKTEIESIISYGASDHKDSEHYSDQMDIYKNFETKKMSFDKGFNYKNAKKIYNPK